jgi:hypothetical protein
MEYLLALRLCFINPNGLLELAQEVNTVNQERPPIFGLPMRNADE